MTIQYVAITYTRTLTRSKKYCNPNCKINKLWQGFIGWHEQMSIQREKQITHWKGQTHHLFLSISFCLCQCGQLDHWPLTLHFFTWPADRLPILQGGTFSFITPTLAILALPKWKCPDQSSSAALTQNSTTSVFAENPDEVWMTRMREVCATHRGHRCSVSALKYYNHSILPLILKDKAHLFVLTDHRDCRVIAATWHFCSFLRQNLWCDTHISAVYLILLYGSLGNRTCICGDEIEITWDFRIRHSSNNWQWLKSIVVTN